MTLPEEFVSQTVSAMGKERSSRVLQSLGEDAITSVRINKNKFGDHTLDGDVHSSQDHCDRQKTKQLRQVAWCEDGYYLSSRPAFTFDPLLHAGCYYVQEASSMFLSTVLHQYVKQPCVMLDLCAAPGGKTTIALNDLPEGSLLISNEPIRNRSQILAENVIKWGNPNHIVTNNYPKEFNNTSVDFDVILTDVPCSGEGMFRKDENAISEWSLQNVSNCQKRQREIISDIWKCLKPGGLFIYSTCTFNTAENEENIKWITDNFDADVLPVNIDESWGITGSLLNDFNQPVYRFLPGYTLGEGLFMAVMRKCGEYEAYTPVIAKCSSKDASAKWLNGDFCISRKNDTMIAFPNKYQDIYMKISRKLNIIQAGITIGTMKGHDLIPDVSLALSTELGSCAFPQVDLDYNEAINYLQKQTTILPSGSPRGFVIVTYKNHPLGFVKNIGNRANNLYPQEWRIRSTHVPADHQDIYDVY